MNAVSGSRALLYRYHWKLLAGDTQRWLLAAAGLASLVAILVLVARGAYLPPGGAAYIAEMMTPLLGAFLITLGMAPEYGSSGTFLASRPAAVGRVVTTRLGLAMIAALVATGAGFVLQPFSAGVPVPLSPLLAAIPSLWFLSTLALLSAALFRSPWLGFATAVSVWGLDAAFGYTGNVLFSLHGAAAAEDTNALSAFWLPGKLALLAAGAAMLWAHNRRLFRPGRMGTRADSTTVTAGLALLILGYILSGAAIWVAYGYLNRARLPGGPASWLQTRARSYGPVPVAAFFGPAFQALVTPPPEEWTVGRSPQTARAQQLEQALARWPRSLWADSIAMELASKREGLDETRDLFALPDRFPRSPFAVRALELLIEKGNAQLPPEDRLAAARKLLDLYPSSPAAVHAASILEGFYRQPYYTAPRVGPDEVLQAGLRLGSVGSPYARPRGLVIAASMKLTLGRDDEAKTLAQQARDLGASLLAPRPGVRITPGQRGQVETAMHDAELIGQGMGIEIREGPY